MMKGSGNCTTDIRESDVQIVQEAERLSVLNRSITILAEEPTDEGAPACYAIQVRPPGDMGSDPFVVDLRFQQGAVGRNGEHINGISDEAVIEVLIHRLSAFQAGNWASDINARALACLKDALAALLERGAVRRAAGVEGTTETITGERGHTR